MMIYSISNENRSYSSDIINQSTIKSLGSLKLTATGDITNTSTVSQQTYGNNIRSTISESASLEGGSITTTSGNTTTLQAAKIKAGEDVAITAGNGLNPNPSLESIVLPPCIAGVNSAREPYRNVFDTPEEREAQLGVSYSCNAWRNSEAF